MSEIALFGVVGWSKNTTTWVEGKNRTYKGVNVKELYKVLHFKEKIHVVELLLKYMERSSM